MSFLLSRESLRFLAPCSLTIRQFYLPTDPPVLSNKVAVRDSQSYRRLTASVVGRKFSMLTVKVLNVFLV